MSISGSLFCLSNSRTVSAPLVHLVDNVTVGTVVNRHCGNLKTKNKLCHSILIPNELISDTPAAKPKKKV